MPHQFLGFVARAVVEGCGVTTVPGYYPRTWAKNCCVKVWRTTDHDRLLIVDADMIPTWEAYEAVMAAMDDGADLANAKAHVLRSDEGKLYLEPNNYRYGPDGIFESCDDAEPDAMGGAFTGYAKAMLDDRTLWVDDAGAVFTERCEPDGQILWSEDMDFSARASEAGYALRFVDVTVGHLKELNLADIETSFGGG